MGARVVEIIGQYTRCVELAAETDGLRGRNRYGSYSRCDEDVRENLLKTIADGLLSEEERRAAVASLCSFTFEELSAGDCRVWGNSEGAPWESPEGSCITGYCICVERDRPYLVRYKYEAGTNDPDAFVLAYPHEFGNLAVSAARQRLEQKREGRRLGVETSLKRDHGADVECVSVQGRKDGVEVVCRKSESGFGGLTSRIARFFGELGK